METQAHAVAFIDSTGRIESAPAPAHPLRALAYRAIQCALLPVGGVGYVSFVAHMVASSRRTGTSATLLASFYTRWMQHALGTRRDEACARLMAVLPNVSPLALRMLTAPTRWAHRVTRHVPAIYRYPYQGTPPFHHHPAARTTFYDQALQRHLIGVDQLVVLGAGLDTRAYSRVFDPRIRCFELDMPENMAFKRAALAEARVDTRAVTYVAGDFQHEDWFAKLVAAGFDANAPSLFTWESVSMYLERSAVESTLRTIARTAPGTVLVFDYVSARLLTSRSPLMRYGHFMLKLVGEPWKFGLDSTPPDHRQLAEFLERCGLSLEEQRSFGYESAHAPAPAGFAAAVVASVAIA